MARMSEAERGDDREPIAAPRWPQYLVALTGVPLLVGPTLAALWPR